MANRRSLSKSCRFSGFGALSGISGAMTIEIRNGEHFYTLVYDLPE